jgi:hypothetical protein
VDAVLYANNQDATGTLEREREVVFFGWQPEAFAEVMAHEPPPTLVVVFDPSPPPVGDSEEEVVYVTSVPALRSATVAKLGAYGSLVRVDAPGFHEKHAGVVGAALEVLLEADSRRAINRNTAVARAGDFTETALRNAMKLGGANGLPTLDDVLGDGVPPLAGVPAFICSAGPSLSLALPLLQEASKKGVIFAVNTAAHPVAEHVDIDVLVTIENVDVTHHFVNALPRIKAAIVAMISNEKVYELLEEAEVPFAVAGAGGDPMDSIAASLGLQMIHGGPSVATTATILADLMGCSPIVLLGQDCAFTGGKGHADGTPYDGEKQTGEVEVPAWGGGTVRTSRPLMMFGRWLSRYAETTSPTGPRLINATMGGMHLEDWEELTLRHVLDELPERPGVPMSFRPAGTRSTSGLRGMLEAGCDAVEEACGRLIAGLSTGHEIKEAMDAMESLTRDQTRFIDAIGTKGQHGVLTHRQLTTSEKLLSSAWLQLHAAKRVREILSTSPSSSCDRTGSPSQCSPPSSRGKRKSSRRRLRGKKTSTSTGPRSPC